MESRRFVRRRLRIAPLMFAMSLIMAATACAENNCPWMNEATASDLVGGGDAVGAFAAAQGKSAVCTFTEHDRKAMRTLQISVELAGDPHASFLSTVQQGCRSTSAPLKAIGNEAVTCTIDRHKAGMGERALGRVRDQVFVVTISTTLKDDPILTSAVLKMKIGTAAEQVAGNLF